MSAVPINRSSQSAAPGAIGDLAAGEEAAVAADLRRSTRRRRTWVWAARVGTLVIIIGGWQLLASATFAGAPRPSATVNSEPSTIRGIAFATLM